MPPREIFTQANDPSGRGPSFPSPTQVHAGQPQLTPGASPNVQYQQQYNQQQQNPGPYNVPQQGYINTQPGQHPQSNLTSNPGLAYTASPSQTQPPQLPYQQEVHQYSPTFAPQHANSYSNAQSQAPLSQLEPLSNIHPPQAPYPGTPDQKINTPPPQSHSPNLSPSAMSGNPYGQQPMQTMQPGAMPGMDVKNAMNLPRNAEGEREWSNGFFSCFDDFGTCCLAWFCPCMVYSQVKSRYHHLERNGRPHPEGGEMCTGDCALHGCLMCLGGWGCVLQIGNRGNIRDRYRISGDGFMDCLSAWCCTPCELSQESRELELEERALGGGKA